ncbi:hypothetical protein SCLCIDRAFT_307910 [Scleroderma citrinum Foug A]|uniref:Uncharacterized protein n=1 Tax=Scleroderma citrinum Foug A TaxID=1036808 RepID=A0A0C2Z0E1_9AGAM|nr:hypothetical protein SCLCIDRAFT_307910 [Scleroderma citrinum Foug A]
MSRSRNSQQEKEELQRRIRGLTTILHGFTVQQWPPKQPRDTHSFLRHFTTLLACGSKCDTGAQSVIAVTGSIDPGQKVRALIVAQNPHANSPMGSISLNLVQKPNRSLDEVMASPPSPDLINHIADTWAALSAVDRCATDYVKQLVPLENFFLRRSFHKLSVRFREDTRLCGGKRLNELIGQWKPNRPEIALRWVNPPEWLVMLKGLPKIKSTRMVRGQPEWEFSDKTKYDWSRILAVFLTSVGQSIEDVKQAREENLQKEMETLNFWCRYPYYFVTWKAGIVRDLLMKTNMVNGMTTAFMPMRTTNTADEFYDELAKFELEAGGSTGVRVLRYLWTVVAWHAAVYTLCNNKALPELLKDIEIDLIQMPRSPSSVLTLPEISEEFFKRFPLMIRKRQVVLKTLERPYSKKRCHSDNMLFDFVHSEAALMGLLNYYKHHSAQAGQDVEFWEQRMQQIVQPLVEAGEAVIAISEECCWCCDWLSKNSESQFTLPGTHGMIYPWDPPKVGVSELVLKKLEGELWNQLYEAVMASLARSISPPKIFLTNELMPQFIRSLLNE